MDTLSVAAPRAGYRLLAIAVAVIVLAVGIVAAALSYTGGSSTRHGGATITRLFAPVQSSVADVCSPGHAC